MSWAVPLALAYLGAARIDGIRGVLILMGAGAIVATGLLGHDALAEWRRGRAEQKAVRRRWEQWDLEEELRRAGWRKRS